MGWQDSLGEPVLFLHLWIPQGKLWSPCLPTKQTHLAIQMPHTLFPGKVLLWPWPTQNSPCSSCWPETFSNPPASACRVLRHIPHRPSTPCCWHILLKPVLGNRWHVITCGSSATPSGQNPASPAYIILQKLYPNLGSPPRPQKNLSKQHRVNTKYFCYTSRFPRSIRDNLGTYVQHIWK